MAEGTTLLEKSAEAVAGDLLPANSSDAGGPDAASGINLTQIMQLVVTVLTAVMQNCPQSSPALAKSIKAPTMLQRVALMRETRSVCDCCGNPQTRRIAGAMHASILDRAAKLTDQEALQVVNEARNFDNLLI